MSSKTQRKRSLGTARGVSRRTASARRQSFTPREGSVVLPELGNSRNVYEAGFPQEPRAVTLKGPFQGQVLGPESPAHSTGHPSLAPVPWLTPLGPGRRGTSRDGDSSDDLKQGWALLRGKQPRIPQDAEAD